MSSAFSSPMRGRFTSKFGSRPIYGFHAGVDIAPVVPGTVGTPVYAARSGVILRIIRGRKLGQSASVGAVLASGRSGDGATIGVGSETDLYGHVAILASLSVGSKVEVGQLIGYTNRSGIQSGPHLHFETWRTRSASSYYDPASLFRAAGVAIGAEPSKYSPPATNPPANNNTNNTAGLALVRAAGYSSISAYQAAQKCPIRLVADDSWGPISQAHYDETRLMQSKMNGWKGTDLRVDGDYGNLTVNRVQDIKARNKGSAWKGVVNTDPSVAFLNMIGVSNAHDHR